MAKDETKRLNAKLLQADRDAFAALKGIDGYAPSKPDCAIDKIEPMLADMSTAQEKEIKANGVAAEMRDTAVSKEWTFHNLMLAVKDQIVAQFGKDSDQLQKIGLKKKSEYKTPSRRKAQAAKA